MTANDARKYRAYFTADQESRASAWQHTVRALWNMALEQREYVWKQRRHTLRSYEQSAQLTIARKDLPWLSDLPAQCAQQTLGQMDKAYDNYWNPLHPAKHPTHKKRASVPSISFPGQAITIEKLNAKWARIRLPKLGWVRFRLSRPIDGIVRNATLSQDPIGWHISLGVETPVTSVAPNGLPGCGVDFGVKVAAFVSDETEGRLMTPSLSAGEQSRCLALERQKARQMRWAKRHNGGRYSKRARRTINKLAALKAKQTRRRLDFTHKLTTDLVKNHGWVAIEDLNVIGMTKSSKGSADAPGKNVPQKSGLNRSILDNTPGERRRQLEYKAPKFGSEVRLVPAPYTSQRCAECGLIDPKNRLGGGREFACVFCGHTDHADRNAALNIKKSAEGQPALKYASAPAVRPSSCLRTASVSA